MPNWRTILSFFLLVILAMPLLVLSSLQAKQLYIKYTMEERLEAGLLKTIFIPQQEFKRLNSHEILVDNKLFDVKTLHATKNGFVATGVFDEEETAVLQQIEKTSSADGLKDTPVFAQIFQLLQGYYFQSDSDVHVAAVSTTELFQNPISPLPAFFQQVISPPPQACA